MVQNKCLIIIVSLWGIVFVWKNCYVEVFLFCKISIKEKYCNFDINIVINYIM